MISIRLDRFDLLDFLGEHGRKSELNAIAIFIATMQMSWIFIVLDQLPLLIVVSQFPFFKGEWEVNRARIILRVHGTDEEVVATDRSFLLHILDDSWNTVRL